jgi:hypothetical protein
MGKFDWQRLILSLDLPPLTKLVALTMSIYARKDGTNLHPGNWRLGLELRMSKATVLRHIAVLRDDLCLILRTERVRAGRPKAGGKPESDVYRLVIPWDLPARVETLDYGRDVVAPEQPDTQAEVVAPEQPHAKPEPPGSGITAPGSGCTETPEVVAPLIPQQGGRPNTLKTDHSSLRAPATLRAGAGAREARLCEHCRKPLRPDAPDKRTCSRACRQAVWRARQRAGTP